MRIQQSYSLGETVTNVPNDGTQLVVADAQSGLAAIDEYAAVMKKIALLESKLVVLNGIVTTLNARLDELIDYVYCND